MFFTVGAKPRTGPHLGMQAAGAGAVFVGGAAPRLGIQHQAVAVGPARQGVNAMFEIEMPHLPRLDPGDDRAPGRRDRLLPQLPRRVAGPG